MSRIYIHYDKKTLIVDSSENLLYPLLGSLLKWNNLRFALSCSLTQSQTDDNAGFSETEHLPISGGLPLLNRVAIGLKSKGTELPGESGCVFIGYSNASGSNGSSLGFVDTTIMLSSADTYTFDVSLTPGPSGGYPITSSPVTIPLAVPFSSSGTFYDLPAEQAINFAGVQVQLAAPLNDGDTSVQIKAEPPVTITASNWVGKAKSNQIQPHVALGCSNGETFTHTESNLTSQCLIFPPGFVMQNPAAYSTVVVFDFKVTNRGLPSQQIQVGYQVVPFVGDTYKENLSSLMAAYTPTFESASLPFNSVMPTCVFIRWPFTKTRFRIHSIGVKKF